MVLHGALEGLVFSGTKIHGEKNGGIHMGGSLGCTRKLGDQWVRITMGLYNYFNLTYGGMFRFFNPLDPKL